MQLSTEMLARLFSFFNGGSDPSFAGQVNSLAGPGGEGGNEVRRNAGYYDPATGLSYIQGGDRMGSGAAYSAFRGVPGGDKYSLNGTPYSTYGAGGNYLTDKTFTGIGDHFGDALDVAVPMLLAGGMGALAMPNILATLGGAAGGLGGSAGATALEGGAMADTLGGAAAAEGGGSVLTGGLGGLEAGSGYGLATLPELGGAGFGASGLGLEAGLAGLGAAGGALGAAAGGGGAVGGGVAAGGAPAAGGGFLSQLGSSGMGSLIGPAANIVGGLINAHAAGSAADAMSGAANAGIAENRRQFDLTRQLLQPYVDAGTGALGSYQDLSGARGPQAQQAAMSALEGSPQYTSLIRQGENAILQNAAATGGLRGGNTQTGLADYRTNTLNGLVNQQLQRYSPLINTGQASAAGVGAQGMAMGQNNANLLGQAGAAQAGGIVAGTNAITNTIGNIGGFFAGQNASALPAAAATRMALPTNGLVPGFGSGIVQGYSNGGNLF